MLNYRVLFGNQNSINSEIIYLCVLILGNHDYYTGDVDNWIKELPRLKVHPLINDRVCLFAKDTDCTNGLYIAGLEDYDTRRLRYA